MDREKLRKAAWAAGLFGVSERRIYEWVREEKVPAVHVGRRVFFDPKTIEAFIRDGGRPLEGESPRLAERG